MFNQLIESEPAGADFQNRRKYFLTSSVVVGILFVTAVVVSIYAADFGLGNSGFELAELVSPPDMAAAEPEVQRPRQPASASPSRNELPTRQANIANLNETLNETPSTVSTTKLTQMARPNFGQYTISKYDSNPGVGDTSGRDTSRSGLSGIGDLGDKTTAQNLEKADPPPPPIKKEVTPEKKPPPQSLGVINGKASYLPKPVYSQAAVLVHADGKVDVQVTIDESGKVISAKAVSGHILLRPAAEQAARSAKFTTTYLSNVPVKVTGVIVYNFTR